MNANFDAREWSPQEALSWYQSHSFTNVPHCFLSHWKTEKSFFYAAGVLFAFEKTQRRFILAGEPLVEDQGDLSEAYKKFLDFAHQHKKEVCGYYVGGSLLEGKVDKLSLGTSFYVDLSSYKLNSPQAKEARRALRKGGDSSYRILMGEDIDSDKLSHLVVRWRSAKLPIHLKFLLSPPKTRSAISFAEKSFVVEKEGEYFAYCTALPYESGGKKAMYLDSLVYDPLQEKFALSYLLSKLILSFQKEGYAELHLGLSPFAKVESNHWIEKLFGLLYRFPFLYRPQGLHFFKKKFCCEERSEFLFVEAGRRKWPALLDMAKVTLF